MLYIMARYPDIPGERTLFDTMAELLGSVPDSAWSGDLEALEPVLLAPARDILSRSGKGVRSRTLWRAWALGGGDPHAMPGSLAVAIELLHVGSLIVDDIQDDSRIRRGGPALHRRYGLPLALNTGNWMYFASLSALQQTDVPVEVRGELVEAFAVALMRCHQGQALDLGVAIGSVAKRDAEAAVLRATRLKTGSLMELATALGARAAGATGPKLAAIRAYGMEFGVGLQMLDDWSGLAVPARREKGREDVRLARATWPWAWTSRVLDDITYKDLLRDVGSISSDWEADKVIERLLAATRPIAGEAIRSQMDKALGALRSGLDDDVDLSDVREDVVSLIGAYGDVD